MKQLIILFTFFLSVSAFAETNQNSPEQAVRIMMDSMKNYTAAPKSGKISSIAVSNNLLIDQKIRKVFNYPHLIHNSLSPSWNKLSKTQQQNMLTKLSRVIELTAYPRGGYYFKTATVQIGTNTSTNKIASVPVDFTLKGTTLKSIFLLSDDGSGYQVIDYVLDGKSLIKLYRNQFSHIISRKGLSYFIKKVNSRYKLLSKIYSR